MDTLMYSLAILALKKNTKSKDKKAMPLILKQKYYELTGMKLHSQSVLKKEEHCEEAVNSMGEPGRTILRLSFFDKKSDKDIAKHLHFESEEQVKRRRLKLLDRCIQILENDGRG
jgi:DNA-directed RNA polymerase specialized sigma subunit